MKAWIVHDTYNYNFYYIVVFAETRGKAIVNALGEPEFSGAEYIDLRAKRFPEADKMDRGYSRLDWDDSKDRYFLVSHGWQCDEDYLDDDDCANCIGKDICAYYKYRLEHDEINDKV